MTREEITDFLISINKIYPRWKVEDPKGTIDAWCLVFGDYTAEQAERALQDYMKRDTSGYAPTAPQLIQNIEKNKHKSGIDWDAIAREIMEGQ